MKTLGSKVLIISAISVLFASCEKYPLNGARDIGDFKGEYLGVAYPDTFPERFCPELFTEELHTPPIFSPDGKEVYFKPMSTIGYAKILQMKKEGDAWTKPYYASFNFNAINDSPLITRDGERLYFLSDEAATYKDYQENIYYVSRSGDDWSDPVMISDNVNDFALHWQFSVADNYNLYFQDAANSDLYVSAFVDGEYQEAEKLPETINSPTLHEGCPYIAPDESYLIFERRQGGFSDLLISFKNGNDAWTDPVALGNGINTDASELYAYLTADDKFLFFLRMTDEGCFPYWIDASVIDNHRIAN